MTDQVDSIILTIRNQGNVLYRSVVFFLVVPDVALNDTKTASADTIATHQWLVVHRRRQVLSVA